MQKTLSAKPKYVPYGCYNAYDLLKMEAICILTSKPSLCRQKELD